MLPSALPPLNAVIVEPGAAVPRSSWNAEAVVEGAVRITGGATWGAPSGESDGAAGGAATTRMLLRWPSESGDAREGRVRFAALPARSFIEPAADRAPVEL